MSDNSIKPSDTFGVIKSSSSSSSSEPDKTKSKSSSGGGTFLERTLKGLGLEGAAKEAGKGAAEIAKAGADQPTPERAAVASIYQAGKTGGKLAVEGAKGLGSKIAEKSKAIHEPYTREVEEARRETGDAAKDYAKGWVDSLNPFDEKNVRDKVADQPTWERKAFWTGVLGAKNTFTDGVDNVKNAGNVVKEYGEGLGETFLHNPIFNFHKEAGKATWGALSGLGGNAKDGAVAATKSNLETQAGIVERTIEQHQENAEEVGGAAKDFGSGFLDSLNPLDEDNVSDAWDDAPTPERAFFGAAFNVGQNMFTGGIENTMNLGNLGQEAVEANFENTITGVKNLGDGVVGGFKSAGAFATGLFGGD